MVNAPIDMETSQSIYFANQVIGFYMMETIAFGLKDTLREEILAGRNFGRKKLWRFGRCDKSGTI